MPVAPYETECRLCGETFEGGCKHVHRVRMRRGEIDITALRRTNLRLDPLLLAAIDGRGGA
jgi:hypothetical protein